MNDCKYCEETKRENWKGNSGLNGTRCINKCWISVRITQERWRCEE